MVSPLFKCSVNRYLFIDGPKHSFIWYTPLFCASRFWPWTPTQSQLTKIYARAACPTHRKCMDLLFKDWGELLKVVPLSQCWISDTPFPQGVCEMRLRTWFLGLGKQPVHKLRQSIGSVCGSRVASLAVHSRDVQA